MYTGLILKGPQKYYYHFSYDKYTIHSAHIGMDQQQFRDRFYAFHLTTCQRAQAAAEV